uniref:Photosystem II reaction center protein Z n=1 Tax=Ananas comosus var. bracteatus TaxID=296719 RepID=A0A6V7PRQ4_ANACO|nr:unnamed protein product [Ananas comosus var. bracteatus]
MRPVHRLHRLQSPQNPHYQENLLCFTLPLLLHLHLPPQNPNPTTIQNVPLLPQPSSPPPPPFPPLLPPPLPSSSSIPNLKPRRRIKTLTLSLHSSTSSPIPTPNPNPTIPTPSPSLRSKNPSDITVLVTGATGYIGRFVVRELLRRGFAVVAVARERSGIRGRDGPDRTLSLLSGASVVFSDVADPAALDRSLSALGRRVDAVVCCLASRSGGVRDSWKIDYAAARNTLLSARRLGAAHFVLLSAICVQKPLLEFQRAKLKFESELQSLAAADENFTFSIVRPPPSSRAWAGRSRPSRAASPTSCSATEGYQQDPADWRARKGADAIGSGGVAVPLIGPRAEVLEGADWDNGFRDQRVRCFVEGVPSLEDAAEFGRIGRYYAAESMLVLDPETGEYSAEKTPSYGKDTLEDFFARVIKEGMAGQELGSKPSSRVTHGDERWQRIKCIVHSLVTWRIRNMTIALQLAIFVLIATSSVLLTVVFASSDGWSSKKNVVFSGTSLWIGLVFFVAILNSLIS